MSWKRLIQHIHAHNCVKTFNRTECELKNWLFIKWVKSNFKALVLICRSRKRKSPSPDEVSLMEDQVVPRQSPVSITLTPKLRDQSSKPAVVFIFLLFLMYYFCIVVSVPLKHFFWCFHNVSMFFLSTLSYVFTIWYVCLAFHFKMMRLWLVVHHITLTCLSTTTAPSMPRVLVTFWGSLAPSGLTQD